MARGAILEVHERAPSPAAAHFLDTQVDRMPFPIAVLHGVDGGSEFAAEFEIACQQRNMPFFVRPPRSPKVCGHVERSHRTYHEEVYQVIIDHRDVVQLNPQLRRWERIHNTVRPHQTLRYLTPLEFLARWKSQQMKADRR